MASEELKPCPFCGGEPYVHEPSFKGAEWQIGCDHHREEEGGVFLNGATWKEVATAWNRRPAPLSGEQERWIEEARGYLPSHWRDTLEDNPGSIVGLTFKPDDAEDWELVAIYSAPTTEIEGWTQEQRDAVANWAAAVLLAGE